MAITEKDLERIKQFRLFDDTFFTVCLKHNIKATQLVLNIILERDDLEVVSVNTQDVKASASDKRSVRLDIHAVDGDNKEYDIEIQRARDGADVRRARYNSSMLDSQMLNTGEEYQNLPDSYVIFITETDVLKGKKAVYNIERMYKLGDNMIPFNDGSHIIYVNGKYNGNDKIGKLIHDLKCSNPDNMNYKVLADTTRYFKEEEKGVNYMCEILEELVTDTEVKKEKQFATAFLKEGKQPADILHYFSILTLDDLKEIQQELLQDTNE